MIAYDTNTKNAYKADTREIVVYGKLYLAKRRISKNLFNMNSISNTTYITNNGDDSLTVTNYACQTNETLQQLAPTLQAGKTYTLSLTSTADYKNIYLIGSSSVWVNGRSRTLTAQELAGKINVYGKANDTKTITNIQIVEGDEEIPFEKYGTTQIEYTLFNLTESNECKIMGFNINEKTDIYYTSLPYNTMTIEVDNTKGYFTDYDDDSIVNKLNNDCYVDLILNINSGTDYITRRMNFDKVSYSDYERAKLSFKSINSILKNLPLRDIDKYFNTTNFTRSGLKTYLKNNYNINYNYDTTNAVSCQSADLKTSSVENILLEDGTYWGDLRYSAVITNNYLNQIYMRKFLSSPQETILKDYQLEKPTIKRENTYQGVLATRITSSSYLQSSETYNKTITGTLSAIKEILIYRDNDYKLNDLTSSNVTISGATIIVETNTIPNILILTIEGNINDEYTITINKTNIYKRVNDVTREYKYGLVNDTSKVLTINQTSPLLSGYYNLILNEKKIRSYVEVQIMGLPYLEVGDTIEVQTDNANILMTITEIDTNYDGGLLQTIKGYELGWDALFPSNTLYPNDELYPNTPL